MKHNDFKQVIKYMLYSCTSLTASNISQLNSLCLVKRYSLRDLKQVYRIAIDNGIWPVCPYCNKAITDVSEFTIDHRFPKSLGGADSIENLQPMHKKCNAKKGNSILGTDVEYEITINLHIRKRTRSNKEKERCRNRHRVVKSDTVEGLEKQCKNIDKPCRYLCYNSRGKRR